MDKAKYLNEFRKYYDDFMNDLFGVLRIPSVLDEFDPKNTEAPFGKPIRDSLDYMLELGKKDGFKAVNVDNYSGFLEYGEGEKVLLILCHLDVVPATGVWTNPPFEPIVKDGKIYGRGTSDDKGPLMASYYAIKMLRDENYDPGMKVRFFFGCDEESGSRGLHKYYEKYGECDYGFSPDANFPCIFAEKGISSQKFSGKINDSKLVSFKSGTVSNVVPDVAKCTLSIDLEKEFMEYAKENNYKASVNGNEYTLYGKAAHGSIPETGINAALNLIHFLAKYLDNEFVNFTDKYLYNEFYGEKLGIAIHDEEMHDVSNNAAIFELNNKEFHIITNIRYPKGFDFDEQMKKLETLIKEYGMTLTVLGNSPYHYVSKESKLVKSLMSAYKKYVQGTELDIDALSIGGGTYARDFKNAVAFGVMFPDEIESMHMPDENADLVNLIISAYIIKDAIKNICD